MIGTVPYLGFYLSDLTFIDSAYDNYVLVMQDDGSSKKFIHFKKHRKNFEILVQIKLFQLSVDAYGNLQTSNSFKRWFDTNTIYTEDQG
jgi:hypothetical protein